MMLLSLGFKYSQKTLEWFFFLSGKKKHDGKGSRIRHYTVQQPEKKCFAVHPIVVIHPQFVVLNIAELSLKALFIFLSTQIYKILK